MKGRTLHLEVEPRSKFAFKRGLSYICSILFTQVKFTCVQA